MATYQLAISAVRLPASLGAALGYRVVDHNGDELIARTTAGITDAENAEFLAGLFAGPVPSCIDILANPGRRGPDAIAANRERVAMILMALGVSYWEEHDSVKKRSPLLAAVREAAGIPTTTEDEPTTEEATDGSGGDGSSSS